MSSLYDSLLERMNGHQYSNYFSTWCVYEEHKSPALLVFDDGLFVCLSCHKKGTHQQLERRLGSHFTPKQSINTVSRILPRWITWEQKYGDLEGIAYYAHTSLTRFPQTQSYFKKRKIYEYSEEGYLGYLDGWGVFPVRGRDGSIVDLVVRALGHNSDLRYSVSPSVIGSHNLYVPCWKEVDKAQIVYVVYGIIDSISMHLAGLPCVTGVTGKSLSSELLRPLNKKFIIVPDEDEEREAHVLANELGMKAKVKRIKYEQFENEKIKDPDAVYRFFGKEALLQSLA